MYNFKGITQDTLMLLEMNRFNNNKPFYEEHKKELNENARKQWGALTLDLADVLYDIDENMHLDPKKVSRIRRDTRFTKDKSLYRANLWTIWSRPVDRENGEIAPGMWAEFSSSFYSYGVGLWGTTPSFMEFYRKELISDPKPFIKALLTLNENGFALDGERYKRDKPGTEKMPDGLKEAYNRKALYFIHSSSDINDFASEKFVDILKDGLKSVKPMYKYLDELAKKFSAEKER